MLRASSPVALDSYVVHFGEELSALDGSILAEQARFAAAAMHWLLQRRGAEKILVVAHSMGKLSPRQCLVTNTIPCRSVIHRLMCVLASLRF